MSDVVSAPVSTPSTPAASTGTRSAIMSAIKQPTISTPTAPAAEPPAPVEGAVKYEGTGNAPVSEPTGNGNGEGESSAEPQAELEATPEAILDYEAKYRELFDSGDLHASLHDKMLMAKINGEEMPVSVKEALQGYMRRSDHSRLMNEVAQQRQAVDADRQQFANMLTAFKDDPGLALDVFGERYGDAWIDQVVARRQAAQADYENAILGAGYRVMAQYGLDQQTAAQDPRVLQAMKAEQQRLDNARKLEAENKALKRRQAEIDAAAQQKTQQSEAANFETVFKAQVKRFAEPALRAEGLTVNSVNAAALQEAVAQVIIARNAVLPDGKRDVSVTQDVVREAAAILRETRGNAKPAGEPPLPVRQGLGTGAGAPVANPKAARTRAEIMASMQGKR